jgi:rRNA processing protein Krr1/Pno1
VAIRGNPERCEEAKKEILTLDVVSNTQVLVGREFNYLLGHKGSRINDLVQTHKVVIDVKRNKEEDTATAIVIGLASRVADTMEAIQELMDNNREVVERLAVDSVLKNILLAVAGKHIKALQSNVNEKLKEDDDTATCYLSFPKERQDSPELLVKAKQSVIESATALTEAALRELQGLILTFTVDPYIVPRILGKGGETIKKLTNGKPLFLEVERSSGKVVVGATTPEGRESLLSEVKQIVAENSVLRVPGDPDLMKSQYRELSRSKTKAALQQLVWVDIDESKNVFILRGKQEDLEKAKAMLEEYLASNSLDEVTVMDDDYDVLLTGGKGSKLVKMSKELEVSMSADQSKGTITLRGHPDNVTKAKAMLRTFLNGGEGQSVAKVVASDQVVGTIIGKGGQTRKDLESKYEVSIHISKDTYRVSIRGPEDKVQECRLEILKMISAARVTQVVSISAEQQAKLQKNDVLKRITQETHSQLSVAEDKVTVRGFFHDVRDAVSLLNEKLTGEYTSSLELDSSQFSRVSATCRDSSHLQRIESATEAKVELVASSGEIRLRGKRSNVRKGKEQIYDFLAFVCPGESQRLKITKPLYQTVGQPTSLAEVSAAVGGSTIYLDRDTSSIVIRDASAGKVEAAAKLVATKIKDAGRLAYILEIAPHEAWLVSYVIGKNGGRIQSLQKGSDCHLDVSKESRTITVTGESDEKVSKVREKLDALVAKARRENVLVRIPEKAIPAFVGHGGKKIKDLSKEHAVEIQRVRKSSQFKIIGDETKVASAKTFIDDWVDRWQESNASVEMKVEKHYVSAILGQKGSTTRAIEKDFDCKIDLDREALTLTIRGGDKEKRQNALEKIKEVMATEAATQAERAAKKKESAKTKEDESPSDPSDSLKVVARSAPVPPASEAASNTKPQAKPNGKKKESNPFPSKPIGMELVSKKKEGKPANAKQSMDGGTEQGHNLFNLLVGE